MTLRGYLRFRKDAVLEVYSWPVRPTRFVRNVMVRRRFPEPVSVTWSGAAVKKMMSGLTVSALMRKYVRFAGEQVMFRELFGQDILPDNF